MARKPPLRDSEREETEDLDEDDFDLFDFPDPPPDFEEPLDPPLDPPSLPPEPPVEPAPPPTVPPDPDQLRSDLESYTLKALKDKAGEWGVDLTGKRRKAEIIEAIVLSLTVRGEEPRGIPPPPEDYTPELLDEDLHFGKLEDLWIEATNALAQEDYKAALALSRDSLQLLEEWAIRYRRGMCSRALQAAQLFLRRFESAGSASDLKSKVKEAERAYLDGNLEYCARLIDEIQDDVATVYVEEMGRVREILVEKENILEELGVINADLARAREMLIRSEEALRLGDHSRTLELIHGFEEVVEEARRKRRGELEDYLETVESMIHETEELGSPLRESRKLAEQARTAFERGDLVLATEIAQRSERSAMDAQKRQIEVAMQLRRKHYRDVRDLVAYLKPLLREAQAYGINTGEVRGLVREAVELLRKEDYFQAMERGHEARKLLEAMQPTISLERGKRGITKPKTGLCEECASEDVDYWDDGWSACNACGHRFLWSKQESRSPPFFRRKKLAR